MLPLISKILQTVVTDEEAGQLKTTIREPLVTDGLFIQFMQRILEMIGDLKCKAFAFYLTSA